jgi:hypothetical protein
MPIVHTAGEVYLWGRADSGQLGVGYDWVHETDESVMGLFWPQRVTGKHRYCDMMISTLQCTLLTLTRAEHSV